MAFNSATYRMNKARRDAWAHLDRAREIRARIASGEWPARWKWQIASQVKLARLQMNLFRARRDLARLDERSAVT